MFTFQFENIWFSCFCFYFPYIYDIFGLFFSCFVTETIESFDCFIIMHIRLYKYNIFFTSIYSNKRYSYPDAQIPRLLNGSLPALSRGVASVELLISQSESWKKYSGIMVDRLNSLSEVYPLLSIDYDTQEKQDVKMTSLISDEDGTASSSGDSYQSIPVPDMWSKDYIGLYSQYAAVGIIFRLLR